jgi:hypothetical protein
MSPIIQTLANSSAYGYRAFAGEAPIQAYESIATTTVGSGGTTTITFSSIPSSYQHLQLRILQRGTGAGTNYTNKLQFNGDTTSANYREHYLYGDGSSAVSGTVQQWYIAQGAIPAAGDSSSIFGTAVVDILDYTNTNKNKVVRGLSGFDANGSGEFQFDSLLWMNTGAINQITMEVFTTNFAQHSQVALYGIKG